MHEITDDVERVAGGFAAIDFGNGIGYGLGSICAFGISAFKNYNADWAL